jgi:hypothetical protein
MQLDGAAVENQFLPTLKPSDAKFEEMYRMTVPNMMKMKHVVDQSIIDEVIASPNSQRLLEEEWLQLKDDRAQLRMTFPDGMRCA